METKPTPKFRITITDLPTKKSKVITVYTDKNIDLDTFKTKISNKIKEIE